MSNEAAWLLLSFAIMVVAMLATLYEKVDRLQKRLDRLETPERAADEQLTGPAPGR
jgi:4-hydroxybenzoate polyprenyltransferase